VAETNACNLFAVSMEGVVLTPTADACLPGVTRGLVIKVRRGAAVRRMRMLALSYSSYSSSLI